METKWLEDLLSLAETRSFSRSAQLRRITQPAFSRRIQALEAWAGADLVDRSSYPTRLTSAGESVHAQAIEILAALQFTSNLVARHSAHSQDMIEFAVPQSLALTFFPAWLATLLRDFGPVDSRLLSLSEHDSMLRLAEGASDFAISYHHAADDMRQPMQIASDRFEMIVLGSDTLAPFSKASPDGTPLHDLPARHAVHTDEAEANSVSVSSGGHGAPPAAASGPAPHATPFLSFPSGSFLGALTDHLTRRAGLSLGLRPMHESDMAEGLAAMVALGHGVAFLPSQVAATQAGLVSLAGPAGSGLEAALQVRLYRERPGNTRRRKQAALDLWTFLEGRPPTSAGPDGAPRKSGKVTRSA